MKLINIETGELTDGEPLTSKLAWQWIREVAATLSPAEKIALIPQLEVARAATRAANASRRAESDVLGELIQYLTIWYPAFKR